MSALFRLSKKPVIARRAKPDVAICFSYIAGKDSHTSDIGHWFGMTERERSDGMTGRGGYPKGTCSASLHRARRPPLQENLEGYL